MNPASAIARIDWCGRAVDIEYRWVGSRAPQAPVMVFLHEGLGSVSMWRDFPQQLCLALGARGLVYSRPGYGGSTPRGINQAWSPDFMHQQAHQVLPELLGALAINPAAQPLWLFGHSDGGSIALLYAAHHSKHLAGLIVLAPHIVVEDISIRSIEQARLAYLNTDLRQKLARYHTDPDSAFWGWNNIWLDPAFRDWRIDGELSAIGCPLLAVQGLDDEYGTLEQIRGIARVCPQTELLELTDCGHSPHRDQPERLIQASTIFFNRASSASSPPD